MLKDLGARPFNYGYASPVSIAATYYDDGSVNVMNLHEGTRTIEGHLTQEQGSQFSMLSTYEKPDQYFFS